MAAGRSLAGKPGRLKWTDKMNRDLLFRICSHFERSMRRLGIRELGAISSESSRPRSSDNG